MSKFDVRAEKPSYPLPSSGLSLLFNGPNVTAESHRVHIEQCEAHDRYKFFKTLIRDAHIARNLKVPIGEAMKNEVKFASYMSSIHEVAEEARAELRAWCAEKIASFGEPADNSAREEHVKIKPLHFMYNYRCV
ncbi:MAG: hypothetical protein J0L77_06100 [Alphaproteobacteria bacterium]|nr:hypothetical protein [Alphaproteobacteria bacterium]